MLVAWRGRLRRAAARSPSSAVSAAAGRNARLVRIIFGEAARGGVEAAAPSSRRRATFPRRAVPRPETADRRRSDHPAGEFARRPGGCWPKPSRRAASGRKPRPDGAASPGTSAGHARRRAERVGGPRLLRGRAPAPQGNRASSGRGSFRRRGRGRRRQSRRHRRSAAIARAFQIALRARRRGSIRLSLDNNT